MAACLFIWNININVMIVDIFVGVIRFIDIVIMLRV